MVPAKHIILEESIPKGFEVYILFLIPSSEWPTDRQNLSEEKLRNNFCRFGNAIGADSLSIWFIDSKKQPIDGYNTDILRCKNYCDKFDLNYNEGPFIVVTKKNPDESTKEDIITINFKKTLPKDVIVLLNDLEQRIRRGQPIKKPNSWFYLAQTFKTWASEHKEDIKGSMALIKVTVPMM